MAESVEPDLKFYRKGLLLSMWTASISGALLLVSLILWGLLSLLGDVAGTVVARVISALFGIVACLSLFVLVILLARLQLTLLNTELSHEDQ